MFDYESLRIIWWAILVFLICGFAVMDGFDFGIAMLHRPLPIPSPSLPPLPDGP